MAIIAAIVSSDQRTRATVLANNRTSCSGRTRRISAETIAARNKLVPVADSQLNVKTASSALSAGTIGGARSTAWFRMGIGKLSNESLLRNVLTCGNPQTKTNTDTIAQGIHATNTCLEVGRTARLGAASAVSDS